MSQNPVRQIKDAAKSHRLANGDQLWYLPMENQADLAESMGIALRDLERQALENGVVPERYLRNFNALSYAHQIRLLNATVVVVGLGGLGGAVVETLARIGIGHLGLIDGDTFMPHNLNRQILSETGNIGRLKAKAARDRVARINPAVQVTICQDAIDKENALKCLGPGEVIVDCLDNHEAREVLRTAAAQLEIPLVTAALAGYTGYVTVCFPNDPPMPPLENSQGALDANAEAHLGCLPQTATVIGTLEAQEVVSLITRQTSCLRDHILVIDLTDHTFLRIRRIP